MKNLRRHNSPRGAGVAPLIAVSVLAVAIFGADALLGGSVRASAQAAAGSLWASAGAAASAIETSGALESKRSLAEENIALRAKLAELQGLTVKNETLAEENQSLRAQVGAVPEGTEPHTFAVLSYEDASPYGTFVIDGGSSEGVHAGAAVYAEGGVLVGTVSQAGTHTAQVRTLLAPGREVQARVGSSTSATLYGRGGGNGTMRIPRDIEVSEGDLVYYQGGRSVLGVVGAVASSPADAEKTLFVHLPFNLYGTRFVSLSL